jgi:nucleolar GTP-binding protein
MNKITYADSEVAEYQFTTKSLFVGHTYYKNIKWQVIDTPGLLDRSLEERNIIEMQSITALAHLDACVLYFVDISENCGHSIYEQLQLFESIKPLFKNKPLVIIANKTDIQPYNELSDEDKKLLENSAKEHNTYLIQMSNETGNGIIDVKSNACDILLKYRSVKKNGTNKDITGMDKVYVAQPVKRDNRKREPNIPESVIEERKNMIPEEISEEKFLREDNIHIFEKKIKNNPIKDLIEKNGGTGIYYFPQREEFKLENPEWKYDIWPEIMDGKNVFDFIDKDILSKVEALEKEEEENMNNNDLNDDSDTSDLDDDLIEAHEKVMKNQKLIRERHELVKKNRVPKRLIGDTATEKFMDNVRPDLKEKGKEIRLLALKKGREKKEKLRKSLKKDAEIDNKDNIDIEENNLINDDMDIDDDNIKIKKRKVNNEEEKKIKIEEQKKKTLSRMQRKIQRNWSRKAIVNEADRHIGDKKPKFFNSGKRGIGKTDWS